MKQYYSFLPNIANVDSILDYRGIFHHINIYYQKISSIKKIESSILIVFHPTLLKEYKKKLEIKTKQSFQTSKIAYKDLSKYKKHLDYITLYDIKIKSHYIKEFVVVTNFIDNLKIYKQHRKYGFIDKVNWIEDNYKLDSFYKKVKIKYGDNFIKIKRYGDVNYESVIKNLFRKKVEEYYRLLLSVMYKLLRLNIGLKTITMKPKYFEPIDENILSFIITDFNELEMIY